MTSINSQNLLGGESHLSLSENENSLVKNDIEELCFSSLPEHNPFSFEYSIYPEENLYDYYANSDYYSENLINVNLEGFFYHTF